MRHSRKVSVRLDPDPRLMSLDNHLVNPGNLLRHPSNHLRHVNGGVACWRSASLRRSDSRH